MRRVVFVVVALPWLFAAPVETDQAVVAPVSTSQSLAPDMGLVIFDQNSAGTADQNKNYIIYAFDDDSCVGDKAAKCQDLERAFSEAVLQDKTTHYLGKFREHSIFGKANKNDFPAHKQELDNAKVPLPAVLFWPAGHSRPSCKFDSPNPSTKAVADWLLAKVKDEEDDFLELDEGAEPGADNSKLDETSLLVCQANGGPNLVSKEEPFCEDLLFSQQDLVQLEKTQKLWDFKQGKEVFAGPADNSLVKTVDRTPGVVRELDNAKYSETTKLGVWNAIYFYAPWCHHCSCLDPVWASVAGNLVSSKRQPELILSKVDGDANVDLRHLFNVTVYPTFLLINKDGTKVLGRYLGPRKAFELSSWIEDLILADENPILKKKFTKADEGDHTDLGPVFPYTGPSAFPAAAVEAQALATVSVALGVRGNDFDECLDSDEAKFTAPGAALLVQHASDARSLEFDNSLVSVEIVPDRLTIVDFYAPWCPHCQHLNPVWDALSSQVDGVRIGKVDTDAHVDIKRQFKIRRFPTIMYFEPGKKMSFDESRRYTGQRDVEHLKQWVTQLKAQFPSQAAK